MNPSQSNLPSESDHSPGINRGIVRGNTGSRTASANRGLKPATPGLQGILSLCAQWLFAAILLTVVASAQQAGTFSGYTSHLWQAPDGLPEQTVQAFAQTPDGYLWIGTTGGLLRFDGAHFTLFDRQNTLELHENSVFCLMVAKDGTLWIGTEGGGILTYTGGSFHLWPGLDGRSNDFVRAIAQDPDGAIWAGPDRGLLRLSGDRFKQIDGTASIPPISVHSIYRDRAGHEWVGGWRLMRIDGNSGKLYSLGTEASQNQVKSILQTRDGTLWVGTVAGLNRMMPGQERFHPVAGITSTVRVLRQTQDGVLWIGTIGQGVFTFDGGKLTQITAPSGLPSNTVLNFFEDGEKNFWIGTQTGMLRLTRSRVSVVPLPKANDSDFGTIYQDRDGSFWIGSTLLFQMKDGVLTQRVLPGMSGIHVRNVFRDESGVLWAGTDGDGIYRIASGSTSRWTDRDGLANNFIRAIAQDRDKSMWVATDGGLSHLVGEGIHPRIVSYGEKDGLAQSSTRSLLEDRHGDLWIGTDRGLSHMHGGTFVQDVATAALAQMKVWAIHEDPDGGLWFGTRNNGLFRLREGRITHFTVNDGLASNAIYGILEDARAHLWMSGPNGISMLNRREVDAQAELAARHFALTFFPISEMAANTEIYGGTQPSGCITSRGDVWFPSNGGSIHLLPLQRSPLPPPPLRFDSVLADGRPVALAEPIALQPATSRLEFVYAPIRLSSQDGIRFRYMLEGFDRDWGPVTRSRTADYTNLAPGSYRFLVRAFEIGSPDAVNEIAIPIVQRPHFYRTWWFISACLLLITLLILAVYRYRVRQVRVRFEAVIEERSRLAREMHDTVIQGCTGVSALLEAAAMEAEESGLLDFARVQLRGTIDEARDAIWNLRKPSDNASSLPKKLEGMTRQVGAEFGIPIAYSVDGTPFPVDHPLEHDLLMVAREAVSNAALHGRPSRVEVVLAFGKRELQLNVSDDGSGFDRGAADSGNGHHFGIQGMEERVRRWGGKFHLASSPGHGAEIEVRVPRRN
jgi:ligand-binding sensor domain-containing protein/signal transduction histidine kinase